MNAISNRHECLNVGDMDGKPLPFDEDSENAILGCMLIDEYSIREVSELHPSDFHDSRNRVMFQAMLDMQDAGMPWGDSKLITAHMKQTGVFDLVGVAHVAKIATSASSSGSLSHFVSVVQSDSRSRSLIKAAVDMIHRCMSRESPEKATRVMESALSRHSDSPTKNVVSLRELGERKLASIRERAASPEGDIPSDCVETGIDEFDVNYGGIRAGQNIIIAARPGDGKSALGKQIASNVSSRGVPVMIVTLEMEEPEFADRIWSERILVDGRYVQSEVLTDAEILRLEQSVYGEGTDTFRIYAPTGRDSTWERLSGFLSYFTAVNGTGLIVIDYLQLVAKSDPRQEDYSTISNASKGAKRLARKLQIPIISLAQIGRESDKGARRLPRLSDLRGAGDLEQDADAVVFLHRKEERKPDFEVVVAKWRNGEPLSFPMTLDGKHTRFIKPKADSNDGF